MKTCIASHSCYCWSMPKDGVFPISNTNQIFWLMFLHSFRWSREKRNIDVKDWPDSRNKTDLLNRLKNVSFWMKNMVAAPRLNVYQLTSVVISSLFLLLSLFLDVIITTTRWCIVNGFHWFTFLYGKLSTYILFQTVRHLRINNFTFH